MGKREGEGGTGGWLWVKGKERVEQGGGCGQRGKESVGLWMNWGVVGKTEEEGKREGDTGTVGGEGGTVGA